MIEEITIKFGTELKLTQHNWKSQLYTFFLLKKKPCYRCGGPCYGGDGGRT